MLFSLALIVYLNDDILECVYGIDGSKHFIALLLVCETFSGMRSCDDW